MPVRYLKNAKITHVSYVKRGANNKKFFMMKGENNNMENMELAKYKAIENIARSLENQDLETLQQIEKDAVAELRKQGKEVATENEIKKSFETQKSEEDIWEGLL